MNPLIPKLTYTHLSSAEESDVISLIFIPLDIWLSLLNADIFSASIIAWIFVISAISSLVFPMLTLSVTSAIIVLSAVSSPVNTSSV